MLIEKNIDYRARRRRDIRIWTTRERYQDARSIPMLTIHTQMSSFDMHKTIINK
jgi:hypothetical protein